MATQRISKGQTAILSLPRTQPFHFLKLPAELRNEVYRYCLILDAPIYIKGDNAPGKSHYVIASTTSAWSLSMPLLRTSKQLHEEAMFILYSENNFRAYNLESLRIFCSARRKRIGPDARALRCIQTLTVGNDDRLRWSRWRTAIDDDYRHSFEYFQEMTNLKSLTLLMETDFERPRHIPAPLSASGALLTKEDCFQMLPVLLPNLPKKVVSAWLSAEGPVPEVIFEVTMRARKFKKLQIGIGLNEWLPGTVRIDRYRLAANLTADVGRGLSQIRRNYNLVYVNSRPA